MNPGLDIALAVELQRRALLALLTPEDKAELMIRNWRPPADEAPPATFDVFALAGEKL
jgi:hypothetical protein